MTSDEELLINGIETDIRSSEEERRSPGQARNDKSENEPIATINTYKYKQSKVPDN